MSAKGARSSQRVRRRARVQLPPLAQLRQVKREKCVFKEGAVMKSVADFCRRRVSLTHGHTTTSFQNHLNNVATELSL